MATPLIEVIESCEQDIATYRDDLKDIIAEAEADGVVDEEEQKEIVTFETSIADLERFVQEKRAEFEKNKAEWEALASDVSELLADFQTLTDWGAPNLSTVDSAISEMDQNAANQFYRDAILSYENARASIDPMTEEYNKQSAAKLSYDEDRASAGDRAAACQSSEAMDRDIQSRLDQVDADFQSCDILAEQLDYVTALSSLQSTIDEISNIESLLEANAKAKERVLNLWGVLMTKRSDVLGQLQDHRDLLDDFLEEFGHREATFNALVNDSYFDQAEDWIAETEEGFASHLEMLAVREEAERAEQEKREADEALLAQDRDALASELSATAPKETLWKLYEWQSGDSFIKLAKDSGLSDPEALLGFPNNQKLANHYRAEDDLPPGTLVCVVDASIEVFTLELNGQTYVLTKGNLDEVLASNQRLMVDAASNYRAALDKLTKNHTLAYDARHLAGWVSKLMTGWANVQPASERDAAEAAVKKLESCASQNSREGFVDAIKEAARLCDVYHKALIKWLAEMQADLADTMWWVDSADVVATATATTLIITISAPASLPMLALYSFIAAAEISTLKSVTKNATIERYDLDIQMVSPTEIVGNAAKAGGKAAFAAFILGGTFKLLQNTLLKNVSLGTPTDYVPFQRYIDAVFKKLSETGAPIPEAYKRRLVEVCWKTFIYRLSAGTLKGIVQPKIEVWYAGNEEAAVNNEPETSAVQIGNAMVTDAFMEEVCAALVREHGDEMETFIKAEYEKLEQDGE